jgi:serine/threonine protein kinase/formylglycine-generating enzyme required for sulfatase activity/dienelactone hydrolase
MTEEHPGRTEPNATAVREAHSFIAVGKMIGSYRIEGLLAEGGMGVVCRATDTKLNRTVAIKFLSDDLLDANARRRFQREAQLASALNHPHILTVHDVGEEDGRQYIVTEFVDGGTLIGWAASPEPRGWRQCIELLVGVADALATAHASDILHRDVKPANILISKSGYAKLADFGLAKLTDGAAARRGSGQFTMLGAVVGTIAYMSPEQAAGRALDARSDIFSFGVVLYELLSGRQPFSGATDLELLQSVIHSAPAPLGDQIPAPLRRIVEKAIEKDPADRYQSMRDLVVDLRHVIRTSSEHAEPTNRSSPPTLERPPTTRARLHASWKIAAIGIIVLAGIAVGIRNWQQAVQAERARSETIPAVAALVEEGDLTAAFELAQQAARYVPDDPLLKTLTPSFTSTYSVTTTPPDAEVYVRGYEAVGEEWQSVGRTPFANVALPRRTLRWRIEKAGFETAELATSWRDDIAGRAALDVSLQPAGDEPSGMVFVPGGSTTRRVGSVRLPPLDIAPFFVDRHEVTNAAYKEFVDAGGYRRREYWEGQEFRRDGRLLSWDEAMQMFVDATGRPGPAAWEVGDYPEGEDDYPVTGVSWHEAMAYARFRGKSLPSVYHWTRAALPDSEEAGTLAGAITPLSNFSAEGSAPVGSHQGLGPHGTYDMHGNVREWIANQGPSGGWALGGGFADRNYMYYVAIGAPLLERSPLIGFRLMRDTVDERSVAALREPLDLRRQRRDANVDAVSDEVFAALASQFAYRSGALNASEPAPLATTDDWTKQLVTVDTGYGERMNLVLFVPTRFEPPLQAVVVWFGVDRFLAPGSLASLGPGIREAPMEFLVKSGRILVFVEYQGSFGRFTSAFNEDDEVRNLREWIERRQDLGRAIDYLETRPEVDAARVAYYGLSFGASYALPLIAVEPRLKVAVLLSGGLRSVAPAAIDPVQYVPRITIPTLMMNGRYDPFFPYEGSQLPLFDRLGTRDEDKRYVPVEGGHAFPPTGDVLREILGWLDKHLGRPVLRGPP